MLFGICYRVFAFFCSLHQFCVTLFCVGDLLSSLLGTILFSPDRNSSGCVGHISESGKCKS